MKINDLPAIVREDGIIDVPRNSHNICTVEAEFDRAMKAAGDFERAHPVEAAVQALEHSWKSNRHNACYNYGQCLETYQKQPEWETVKPLVVAKGLPVTMTAWLVVENNYMWKLRAQLVNERPRLAKTMDWYSKYEQLVRDSHPVLQGKWLG